MDMETDSRNIAPRVSVVIVTYRSAKELHGCMYSLLHQAVPIEILLVDNASPDGTAQMVTDYAERWSNVKAILNHENLGLAAGNNCALGRCRGDYLLFLNPDTVLTGDSLERMINVLDQNQDVGVLGPRCTYEDGTSHVSFHRNWGMLHVIAWRILPYRFVRRLYDRFSRYESQDVLFVSGACLLIRRQIFEEIGGYDSEYFLTVEDAIDLCIRAQETGSRIVFFSNAQVVHYTGRSAAQTPYLVVWQGIRGTIYHFLKHKGKFQALLISGLLGLSSAARVLVACVFGIVRPRYRAVARIYARVLRGLFLKNPIFVKAAPKPSITRRLPTHPLPKVHVVVLNWNNYSDTVSCLSSLRQLHYENYEVVVVDNGSADDSASQIRNTFPEVRVIETNRNLGFAGGCNVGIRYALGRDSHFIWLLNNDTVVDPQALQTLVDKATSDDRIGAVGSAIYVMDDPTRLAAWGGGHVSFWLGHSRHFLVPVPDSSVDFITGASMLIAREAIEQVGLLSEEFFMYWEDADFCYRLRDAHWKVGVAGRSRIWHKGSASVGQASVCLDAYFNASAVRFFRKHAPIPSWPIWTGSSLRLGKRALQGNWKRFRAVLAAVLEADSEEGRSGGGRPTTLEADRKRG